jgi:hypothetical protein
VADFRSVRLRFDADGTLERDGVVTPRGARVVAVGDPLLVVKMPGQRVYAGQGRPWRYCPAEYVLYEADERPATDRWLTCVQRVRWPVRL